MCFLDYEALIEYILMPYCLWPLEHLSHLPLDELFQILRLIVWQPYTRSAFAFEAYGSREDMPGIVRIQ